MTHDGVRNSRVSLLTSLLGALAVASCGASAAAGPLQNPFSGGQPVFADSSVSTVPGQSGDATVWIVNSAPDPVILMSASLIPISDHPAGQLVLLRASNGSGISGRGWPAGVRAWPFRGAKVRHGESSVIFGFSGTREGVDYMTAGLRITYRYHGQTYTMRAWAAAVNCVRHNWRTAGNSQCDRSQNIARNATDRLASDS